MCGKIKCRLCQLTLVSIMLGLVLSKNIQGELSAPFYIYYIGLCIYILYTSTCIQIHNYIL